RRARSSVVGKTKELNSNGLCQSLLPERGSSSLDGCGEGARWYPTESGERSMVQGIRHGIGGIVVDISDQRSHVQLPRKNSRDPRRRTDQTTPTTTPKVRNQRKSR